MSFRNPSLHLDSLTFSCKLTSTMPNYCWSTTTRSVIHLLHLSEMMMIKQMIRSPPSLSLLEPRRIRICGVCTNHEILKYLLPCHLAWAPYCFIGKCTSEFLFGKQSIHNRQFNVLGTYDLGLCATQLSIGAVTAACTQANRARTLPKFNDPTTTTSHNN